MYPRDYIKLVTQTDGSDPSRRHPDPSKTPFKPVSNNIL